MARGFKFSIVFGLLLAAGLALFWALRGSEPESLRSGLMPPSDPGETRAAAADVGPTDPRGNLAVPLSAGEERVDAAHALEQPGQRVAGLVIAEGSRAPVPFMDLRVDGANPETVTTDAEGRFRTTNDFPAGSLEIWFVDHEPLPKSPFSRFRTFPVRASSYLDTEWEPNGEELVIEVALGPTWNLTLVPPPEQPAEDFLVRLRTVPAAERPGTVVLANGFELDANRGRVNWTVAWATTTRLRKHDGYWTRFPELDGHVVGSGPPWMLSVESSDGNWYGEALVDSVSSAKPMQLTVELQPLASLSLSVIDTDGYPEAGIDVNLIRIGADGEELRRDSWRSEQDGRHIFDMLPPGKYLLMATSFRHETIAETLWLDDRERRELDLVCRRKPQGGSIIGTLKSATGTLQRHNRSARIALRRAGEQRLLQLIEPQWDRVEDEWECWFYVGNLPLDEYELSIEDTGWNYSWEPSSLRVVPPAEDIVFVRLDDQPTVDLEFLVTFQPKPARATPPEVQLSFRINGGPQRRSFAEKVPRLRIAQGSRLAWTLSADGYVPQRGDLTSFGRAENGTRVAEVVLRKGWGARITVVGDFPGSPHWALGGALVRLDGAVVGATDDEGVLDVALDSPPGSIEVQLNGWTMRGGGSVRLDSPELEIRMSPLR